MLLLPVCPQRYHILGRHGTKGDGGERYAGHSLCREGGLPKVSPPIRFLPSSSPETVYTRHEVAVISKYLHSYVSPHSSSTVVESEWSLDLMNILDLRKVCGHRDPVLLTLGSLSYFPTGWTTVSTHRVTGG